MNVEHELREMKQTLAELQQAVSAEGRIHRDYVELGFIHQKLADEWWSFVEPHLGEAMVFRSQGAIREHALRKLPEYEGLCLEFGTGWFNSMRLFAAQLGGARPDQIIYGFDTFEGLPEEWPGTDAGIGAFHIPTPGDLPANVRLIKGLVQDTVPGFLAAQNAPIRFMHMDLDLYGPTLAVLHAALPFLRPGAVILFDEFTGYAGYRHGEFKAWREFAPHLTAAGLGFRYAAFSYGQATIIITSASWRFARRLCRARPMLSCPESCAVCGCGWGASACAAPWLRSGGCVRASPKTAGRPLRACDPYSCRCRSACAAPAPRAG